MNKINIASCFKFLLLSAVASCSIILTSCGGGSAGGASSSPKTNANLTPKMVDPVNDATNIPDNKKIVITFNERIDLKSIQESGIILNTCKTCFNVDVLPKTVSFSPDNTIMYITPTKAMLHGETYYIHLPSGIKAVNGDALSYPNIFTFTVTGSNVHPLVAKIDPIDGSSNANPFPFITVVFDHEMKVDSVKSAFSLQKNSESSIVDMSESVVVSNDHKQFIFTPKIPLDVSSKYNITVSTNAQDMDNNNLESAVKSSFITAAHVAPVAKSPQDGEKYLSVKNPKIKLQFSEDVKLDTVTSRTSGIILSRNNGVELPIIVTNDGTAGNKSFDVKLDSSISLDNSTTYHLFIPATVQDLNGNFATESKTFVFTTLAKLPVINAITPGSGSIISPANTSIQVSFSQPIESTSVKKYVSFVSVSGNKVLPVNIQPSSDYTSYTFTIESSVYLASYSQYTLNIGTTAGSLEDFDGSKLTTSKISFTTDKQPLDYRFVDNDKDAVVVTNANDKNYQVAPYIWVVYPPYGQLEGLVTSDTIHPITGVITYSSAGLYNQAIDASPARYANQWFRMVPTEAIIENFPLSTIEFEMVSKFNDSSALKSQGSVELNCPAAAEATGFCKKTNQAELQFISPINIKKTLYVRIKQDTYAQPGGVNLSSGWLN